MRNQPTPIVNILPGEQYEVFLEHRLNVGFRKVLADGAAMFVIDHAGRLVQNFPAAFPGEITKIGVFQVKRFEQLVKAAQLQEFLTVEGAGPTAAVETGIQARDVRFRTVPHVQSSLEPPT